MDEQLQYLRADVEANLDLPEFDQIAARGHRIRRRRTLAAGAGAALVVAIVAVGLTRPFESQRTIQPVERPVPHVDVKAASAVLTDPDAQVDTDTSRVDGRGNTLTLVRVENGVSGSCPTQTAMRWLGTNGRKSAWPDRPRPLVALSDGFVVGTVPARCRTSASSDAHAYFVDASGVPRGITWAAGAEHICAAHPQDLRCRYDVATHRASVVPGAHLPKGTVLLQSAEEGTLWARSGDARRIYWSSDGRSWHSHSTSQPAGAIVSATAAGDKAVLAGNTSVDYTLDAGHTWHSQDLTAALRHIVIGDVDWTVTRSGVLLGVTELVGRGDVLFRSTDPSWHRFVETHVHTAFGLVRPSVEGRAAVVTDSDSFLVSTDDGATWRRTPALP